MNILIISKEEFYAMSHIIKYQRNRLRNVTRYLNDVSNNYTQRHSPLLSDLHKICSMVFFLLVNNPIPCTEVVLERAASENLDITVHSPVLSGQLESNECWLLGPLSGKLYDRDKLPTTLESFFIETSADCDTIYS